MRRVLCSAVMVCCVVSGVLAEMKNIKFSGTFDIQYRSGDSYKAAGDDRFIINDLYLQAKTEINENVEGLLKLDGADLAKETTNSTHKYVEEAQIIFKNVLSLPMTVVFGKDEMPYGQDYDKSLYDPLVHQLEIDKVWGLNGTYKLCKNYSIAAGIWEQSTTVDLPIHKSYTARLKCSPVPMLKAEASFANIAVLNGKDEKRFNAGAIVNVGDVLIHGEYNGFNDNFKTIAGYTLGKNPSLISFGIDYKINDMWKLKARHEILDDDITTDTIEGAYQFGIGYKIGESAALMVEFRNMIGEGATKDLKDVTVGVKVSY